MGLGGGEAELAGGAVETVMVAGTVDAESLVAAPAPSPGTEADYLAAGGAPTPAPADGQEATAMGSLVPLEATAV